MRTLVVTPTYNEADNLPELARSLMENPDRHLLVVDDGSPDGTGDVAEDLARLWPDRIRVMHRGAKQGLAMAYTAGFRYALAHNYDFIVQMDADLSHDPAAVPSLVEAAARADVAVGSRYVTGGCSSDWTLARRLISRGGSLYTRAVLGLPVSDPTSGFKCFRRDALAALDLDQISSRGFGFQVEMNLHCHLRGLRLVEVPIRFVDRRAGQSKMSAAIFFEAMWLVWTLRLRGVPGKSPTGQREVADLRARAT